jgi:hypothetical protein
MTIEELQGKLEGTLVANQVVEGVQWLAREDIRLLTPIEREGSFTYELRTRAAPPARRARAV